MHDGPRDSGDPGEHPVRTSPAWLVDSVVQLADTLSAELTIRDICTSLASCLADLLPGWDAAVLVTSRSTLQLAAASAPKLALLEEFELAHGHGPAISGLRDGPAPFGVELAQRPDWQTFAARARAAGYTVVHTVRLVRHDDVAGIATIFGRGRDVLTDGRVVDVTRLVDAAAIGILARHRVDQSQELAAHLQHALDSRVIIEQAKGVLTERTGVSMQAAFELMRARARATGTRVAAVAEAVLERRWSPPPPEVRRSGFGAAAGDRRERERLRSDRDQPPPRTEHVDDLPVALIAVRPDLSATYANAAWLEITRQETPKEAVEQWLQRIHPRHRGSVMAAVRTAYALGGDTLSEEWQLVTPDGRSRWVEARVRKVRRDGHRGSVLISLIDVTDRHTAVARLPRATPEPLPGLPHRTSRPQSWT